MIGTDGDWHTAKRLRRIFLATVVALALKTLIYDFAWQQLL
jgi:hypothetical protein